MGEVFLDFTIDVNNLICVDLKGFGLELSFSKRSRLLQRWSRLWKCFAAWCCGNETLGTNKRHSTITWRFGAV